MKKELILLVRKTLDNSIDDKYIENLIKEYPELGIEGASFITYYLNNELRGCIGTLTAYQPLYLDIINNAKLAAFSDYRFNPMIEEDFNKIDIEISLLSEPVKIEYTSKENLKEQISISDGIILEYHNNQATYLPSVWESIPDFDSFFRSLGEKANIEEDIFQIHPNIFKYQVKKYSETIRNMSVVDSFYPSKKKELLKFFDTLNFSNIKPRALIVPHAGYIYSSKTADRAYSYIKDGDYKRIIVIGPSHNYSFKNISGSFFDYYDTPLGKIKIDLKYLNKINKKFNLTFFKEAHLQEHSTETQMPFIKHYIKTKVIELIYSNESNLDDLLYFLLKDKDNLIVISSDLSHFLNLQDANKADMNCFNAIKDIDIDLLKQCEACGIIGIKSLLLSSKSLELKSRVLEYRTSFETTGDESSVVGYLSAIIY